MQPIAHRDESLSDEGDLETLGTAIAGRLHATNFLETSIMLRDELLAKMIARSPPVNRFEDWADVLSEFALCVAQISSKLSDSERDRLVGVGAMFYRTLARAEEYRRLSVRDH